MIRAGIAGVLLLGLATMLGAQTSVTTVRVFSSPESEMQETQAEPQAKGTSALSGPATFSISGIVVSMTTGTPLDRAEVTLSTAGPSGSTVADGLTTENGGFRFDGLQAGTYRLEGSRRGYISAGYQEHDGFFTGVVAGPGLASAGLHLGLYPTAVIAGTVTDSSGEPIAGARVRLFRQDQRTGEERVLNSQIETCDDNGTYEFSRVRAGTFYIEVTAAPWYAFHPQPKTDDSGNLLPSDQQPHSPLDVAYPTTFYENGTDSDSATPITVNAGDHVEADFSLHAVPAIRIQIRLQPPGDRGLQVPQLMQQVFGNEEFLGAGASIFGNKTGSMVADIGGVAPGHYTMRTMGEDYRTATVDLTSNLSVDFTSVAAGTVEVTGKIAMASGEKLPASTRVSLMPEGGNRPAENQELSDDGSFTFHSVAAGRYEVNFFAPGARLSILQMLASGGEAQGNRITVAGQPVLLAATLGRGATTLSGFARLNGNGVGGAMLVLVPHDLARQDLYRRDQSNTDGSFTLSRVAPGDYTLIAIDNGWTLEWAKPEVIGPYLARGVRVRVNGERTLALPSAVEVQGR